MISLSPIGYIVTSPAVQIVQVLPLGTVIIAYTVDGGTPSPVYTVSGISLAPGATYDFTHSTPYMAPPGSHTVEVTVSNPNGQADENPRKNAQRR